LLNNDNGGDNNSNNVNSSSSSNSNDNYYWGSRHKCVSSPRYVFLSSNMLTYAPGVIRHNTGNWLKMHMRRLRRIASLASQVGFLFSSIIFYSTNDYIQTDSYGTGTGTMMMRWAL
jgi:hypothetical protein